jgi:hypothetical protein
VYSLVGSSTVGFDLTRSPGGERVAVVLRTGLALGPPEVDRLAAVHPGDRIREEWRRVRVADASEDGPWRASTALGLAGAALDGAAGGDTTLLRQLETSRIGDADAVDRLVRRDLLEWTWIGAGGLLTQDPVASLAGDVLSDAAVAAYLGSELPPDVRRAMSRPFLQAGLPLADDPARTAVPAVDPVLGDLLGADEATRRAWRTAVERHRARTAEWAPAMHDATWALSLSDRLRSSADAQLAAAVAFRQAGFTVQDAAYGVWNALSGVVQATAALDLIPSETADVLLRPWREVDSAAG